MEEWSGERVKVGGVRAEVKSVRQRRQSISVEANRQKNEQVKK